MIYDKPINNGSDAWLRLMRELEAEAYDDSIPCHVPLAASPTLEDIAKAAREAFAAANPDYTPAA